MKIGVLGLNKKGQIILEHLLNKTAHNIYAYGLDGTARERSGVHYCTTAMLPVSYTHLDVYKRQVLNTRMVRSISLRWTSATVHILGKKA